MLRSLIDRLTSKPLVGVDMGSAACKVVELGRAGGKLVLRRAAVVAVDATGMAAALRRALEQAGITANQAAIGLASPELVVKPFDMPAMPRKELSSAVMLEAETSILNGHAKHEVAIDWHGLSAAGRGATRGLLAVVPKIIVASRVAVAEAASLRAAIVDVEGLALWNAYWSLVGAHEPQPRTALVINVGVRSTNLVIARGPDELMLVRDLAMPAPQSEAAASDWLAEIRDSVGYARSKGGLRSLDAVLVTGGGATEALTALVQSATHAPASVWNPFASLAREGRGSLVDDAIVDDSIGPLFAVAIGLALRRPS